MHFECNELFSASIVPLVSTKPGDNSTLEESTKSRSSNELIATLVVFKIGSERYTDLKVLNFPVRVTVFRG